MTPVAPEPTPTWTMFIDRLPNIRGSKTSLIFGKKMPVW